MNLDQQLRTDLQSAIDRVPHRRGSLDEVVSIGRRRRTFSRVSQVAGASVVVLAIGLASIALLGRSVVDPAATEPASASTIQIGEFEVAVDGLLAGYEDRQVYRGTPGPAPTIPVDQFGLEQPLRAETPTATDLDAVGVPSVYLGNSAETGSSVFLYANTGGLSCLRAVSESCVDAAEEQAGALQWTIEATSSDPATGANMVVSWYGLPPQASIVTVTVDGHPVGWQRVTAGAAILAAPIDLGSDLVLTALDAAGTTIDFGRDETGRFIVGQQRFDALTFEGQGE